MGGKHTRTNGAARTSGRASGTPDDIDHCGDAPVEERTSLGGEHDYQDRDAELVSFFKVGMKFEAYDKNSVGWGCGPATVKGIVEDRILMGFDGWAESSDQFVTPSDPDIAPVGYARAIGKLLHAPRGSTGPFEWLEHLGGDRSLAVPLEAFGERPLIERWSGRRIADFGVPDTSLLQDIYGVSRDEALEAFRVDEIGTYHKRGVTEGETGEGEGGETGEARYSAATEAEGAGEGETGETGETGEVEEETGEGARVEKEKEPGLPLKTEITDEDRMLTERWEVGMKLESLDKLYPAWGCGPATIKMVKPGKILVSFDGWTDRYDQWARPTDPDLAPIGATQALGLNMHPPKAYPTEKLPFSWLNYLEGDRSRAVPLDAFGDRPLSRCFEGRPVQKVRDGDPTVFEDFYGVPYEAAMQSMQAMDQLVKFAGKFS